MNRLRSKQKDKIRDKSVSQQKQSKQLAFQNNLLTASRHLTQKSKQTLNYQMMRLFINEKILYLKTCQQKHATVAQIFKFYPFTHLQEYKFPKQYLIDKSSEQNPEQQSNLFKGKILQNKNGIHFVENIVGHMKQNHPESKMIQQSVIFNGIAISIFNDGRIFQGNYHDGKYCGQGLEIDEDGDLYIGHYKDGQKNGQGTFYWFGVNQIYHGKWQGGLPHGDGVHKTAQSTFEGTFSNGVKNGFGTEKFENGDYYSGHYINGICEGYGQYYWADGSSYKGIFSHGVRHGYGIWKDSDQSFYGSYVLDKKQGVGVYTWKNNITYKGNFKDDFRQGYGQLYSLKEKNIPKLVYRGGWQKGQRNPYIGISKQQIEELHRILNITKKYYQQMPIRKARYGHQNCTHWRY